MTFEEKLKQLKVSQDKAILTLAADWAKDNFKYKQEGINELDIWIESIQHATNKSIDSYGSGDCDDYAVFIFLTCSRFVNWNKTGKIDNLRLVLIKHETIGLHLACIYYGEDRDNPLIITSTGAIDTKPMITLQKAYNMGWVITHTFNRNNVWQHEKPKEE